MKKVSVFWFCSFWLLLGLTVVPAAMAGPQIEFGENGGYIQMDLKGQFYIENTDFGSGPNGTSSRTDMHFQRTRLTITGMYDEVWGMKFQTCGNCGSTKTPAGYTYSGVNDSNEDMEQTASFLVDLPYLDGVELMPYHEIGQAKYPALGRNYKMANTQPPRREKINELENILIHYHLPVKTHFSGRTE